METFRLRRVFWRWHAWAGLWCAPVVLILSVTGAGYLWKDEYEAWRHRAMLETPGRGAPLAADVQYAAARAAAPEAWRARLFTPSPGEGRSASIHLTDTSGAGRVVHLDPVTGVVTGTIAEDETLMALLKRIHGTLLIGRAGDVIVELAASWCFVLLATGLYLWWPRPFTVRGFLLPRFRSGRRALLRDLHAVPAVWCAGATLVLLATGIPWASTGGWWFKTLASLAGEWQPRETSASAHRSDLLGGWSPWMERRETARRLEEVASDPAGAAAGCLDLEGVLAIAAERGVRDRFDIALPQGPRGVFSILSDRNRAFSRAYIHLDQYSGAVLADVRFADFGSAAKFFTAGIILHEGRLFGLPNQLLGLVVCLVLAGTVVTGALLWWRVRPADGLPGGLAPPELRLGRVGTGLAIGLALLLPLFAASLAVLWSTDRLWAGWRSRRDARSHRGAGTTRS